MHIHMGSYISAWCCPDDSRLRHTAGLTPQPDTVSGGEEVELWSLAGALGGDGDDWSS